MSERKTASVKMLEAIEAELEEQTERTIKDAMRAMAEKKMTPELALQYWYQVYAFRKIPAAIKRQGKRLAQDSTEKPVDTL